MTKTKAKSAISPQTSTGSPEIRPYYINPKLRHVMNYHLGDAEKDFEEVDPLSLTVPNMTMSIQELVARHARGLPIPTLGQPSYSDQEFPDLRRYDMAEIQNMQEENQYQIDVLKQNLEKLEEEERLRKNPPKPISNPQNDDLP